MPGSLDDSLLIYDSANITVSIEMLWQEGRWEGIMGKKGGMVFKNIYKGHMDKTKVG